MPFEKQKIDLQRSGVIFAAGVKMKLSAKSKAGVKMKAGVLGYT